MNKFKEFILIESNIEIEGFPSELHLWATEHPNILISDCDVIKGNQSLIPKKQMILFSVGGKKLYSYFPVRMLESAKFMNDAIENFKLKLEA